MPIQICSTHNLPQLVLCCQGECLRRYCAECFLTHNLQHTNGVIINQLSKNSLIEWNKFLLDKFQQILKSIKNKGINIIYEMRLNPNYPKGLINELSNSQLVDCAIKIFQQYVQTLATNVQFISACQNIQQLDIPQYYKDLFIFFVYDAASGLYFLQEKTINSVKVNYPIKKIYDFVELALTPKQQRILEQKRKSIVNLVEKQTLIRIKKEVVNSPNRSKLFQLQKQKDSPKKNTLLSQKRMKSYNENNNVNSESNSPLEETRSILNTKQTIKSTQNSVSEDRYKKISESESQKIELKEEIIDPSLQPLAEQVQKVEVHVKVQNAMPVYHKQIFVDDVKKYIPGKQLFKSLQKQLIVEQNKQQPKQESKQQKIEQPVQNRVERLIEYKKDEGDAEKKENEDVSQLQNVKLKLKQKQNSIRELNNVISNEEQQIQCRQNEVGDLNEQIKKLREYKQKCQYLQQQMEKIRKELEFKQRCIAELNKLIGNEEQQLQFRETQVETLTIEIKKLVQWRQKCQQIQAKLNAKEKELDQREKGIKLLNNVIGNQEQQLAYRQSQVQMLSSELKKSQEARASAQKIIQQQANNMEWLKKQKQQLEISLKIAEQNLEKEKQKQIREEEDHQSYDHQLLQQTIELQSQVCARNSDIKELVQILNKIQNQIPASRRSEIIQTLKKLKTVQLSF